MAQQLVTGADFYMQPCWHPHGTLLAWVEWNHPQMPWEGSRLRLGTVRYDVGHLPKVRDVGTLAGSRTVAIFQPMFSPNGRFLAYISNQSGWDNLYLYDFEEHTHRALTTAPVDCGQPAWLQGMRTYGFRHDGQGLYYLQNEHGFRRLWFYDLQRGCAVKPQVDLGEYTFLDQPALAPTRATLACIASTPTLPHACLRCQSRARSTRGVPTQCLGNCPGLGTLDTTGSHLAYGRRRPGPWAVLCPEQ